jgi:hypothetical protein
MRLTEIIAFTLVVSGISSLGGCYALMDTREAALAELQQVFLGPSPFHCMARNWSAALLQDSSTTQCVAGRVRPAALRTCN